jgi:hypothetical protein
MPGAPLQIDPTAGPVDLTTRYLIRLSPVDFPEATGTLAFSPAGNLTRVDVVVRGVPGRGIHEGAIHAGRSCDEIGAVVAELPSIAVDAQGGGSGSGSIPRTMSDLMDGNAVAAYRLQGAPAAEPVLCGAIPLLPPDLP